MASKYFGLEMLLLFQCIFCKKCNCQIVRNSDKKGLKKTFHNNYGFLYCYIVYEIFETEQVVVIV